MSQHRISSMSIDGSGAERTAQTALLRAEASRDASDDPDAAPWSAPPAVPREQSVGVWARQKGTRGMKGLAQSWREVGAPFWLVVALAAAWVWGMCLISWQARADGSIDTSLVMYNVMYGVSAFGIVWLVFDIPLPGLDLRVVMAALVASAVLVALSFYYWAAEGLLQSNWPRVATPLVISSVVILVHGIYACVLHCRRRRYAALAKHERIDDGAVAMREAANAMLDFDSAERATVLRRGLGSFSRTTSPFLLFFLSICQFSLLFGAYTFCQLIAADYLDNMNTAGFVPGAFFGFYYYFLLGSGTQVAQSCVTAMGGFVDGLRATADTRTRAYSLQRESADAVDQSPDAVRRAREWDTGGTEGISYEIFSELHVQAFFNTFARGLLVSNEDWPVFLGLQAAHILQTGIMYPLRMTRPVYRCTVALKVSLLRCLRALLRCIGCCSRSVVIELDEAHRKLQESADAIRENNSRKAPSLEADQRTGYNDYVRRLCVRFGTRILSYTVPAVAVPVAITLIRYYNQENYRPFSADYERLMMYSGTSILADGLNWLVITLLTYRVSGFHAMQPFAATLAAARKRYVVVCAIITGHVLSDVVLDHAKF